MSFLIPQWPAPANVKAVVTTRNGGISQAPYNGFNLAAHVGDAPEAVAHNRAQLSGFGCTPVWLNQVHSIDVVPAVAGQLATADASFTEEPGLACTVLTADCLPVLFTTLQGDRVAAAHAGWRGLAGGILEATACALKANPDEILVWLGPAIGPTAFEVGPEVYETFIAQHPEAEQALIASARVGHFYADLYQLARIRLAAIGITRVFGGDFCTFSDARFYSYRRQAQTGRMASLIWLDQP